MKQEEIQIPYPEELERLGRVRGLIEAQLEQARRDVEAQKDEYSEFMEYIIAHRGEIDPREIFQSQRLLEQQGSAGVYAVQNRDALERLFGSPYFARIDFKGGEHTGQYYIGRAGFRGEDGELLINDWRAPVSSLFYDHELGGAGFDTPGGRVEGQLCRKRQFKITGGVMEYAIESSMNIQDEVLQKELSSTSDEKMRSIIGTIQKEQNAIIREERARVMVIQGVAGSGKTSIALHRIAYLLYRFKETLSADNIVILSPNHVFSDHIANVLPELGEQPVYQMGFRELANIQLEGVVGYLHARDPLETEDAAWLERSRYKASPECLRDIDRYIEYAVKALFDADDYQYEDHFVDKAWIQSRYDAYARYPIKRRVREIEDDIRERLRVRNVMEAPLPPISHVRKCLNAMLGIRRPLALYKDMYKWLEKPRYLKLKGSSLEWEDVFPFLYLYAHFEDLRENHRIKHVVVDEMQDYSPVQFAVLKRLFDCKMTILGDFSQCVDPTKTHTLEDLLALFPGAELMRLEKSYRSTYEIIEFAGTICKGNALRAIERHGPPVEVLACEGGAGELAALRRLCDGFLAGERNTMGILCKHHAAAEKLAAALGKTHPVRLVSPDSDSFTAGISVMSIGMSKGLEFDEVVVAGVEDAAYHTAHDASLLYVACTRAMHRLTVVHTGAGSRLLPV